ncbi:hypothetical protein SNE40_007107 [Patella caerulea]|uniref:Death domain-containing protein n=1 Tax=Patella caerulea TaxID=87958 RepID=A0AAN8K3Z5_PATCE
MPGERRINEHAHHGSKRPAHRVGNDNRGYSKQQTEKTKIRKSGVNNAKHEKKANTDNAKPETPPRAGTPFREDAPPYIHDSLNGNNDRGIDKRESELSLNQNNDVESKVPQRSPPKSPESYGIHIDPNRESRYREPRSVSAGIRREVPRDFDIKSFNTSISDYVDLFSSPKFTSLDGNYPIDNLISVVSDISASIEDYKIYTADSQRNLEELRNRMKTVKENIHMSVTRQAFELQDDDEYTTIEEKELHEKLAKINVEVAAAHFDVAEAIKISAETESTAVKAQISTERAKMEAEQIQEEIDFKAKVEREKKAEQERIAEEERLKKEEQERKEEQARQAKEAEWRRREVNSSDKIHLCEREKWPVLEILERSDEENEQSPIICSVRGHPTKFGLDLIKCEIIERTEANLIFNDHEELVSEVLEIKSVHNETEFQDPVFIGIPHFQTRAAANYREVIVKTDVGGAWVDLPTKEVSFDNRKDMKFAQAEVKHPGILVVMSRFKQDYVTLTRKASKITSSFDQRITFSFPKDTVQERQNLLLQVQYVDSGSIQDYRTRDPAAKGLLASSHIVHMDWDSRDILNPVTVTLPCPPNPAKAKKLAQIRKMKEDKMKNPKSAPKTLAEVERNEAKKAKKVAKVQQKQQQVEEGENDEEGAVSFKKTQNRWYMGEYASSDDDENDLLHFLVYSNGRWNVEPEVHITATKIDLVTFDLPRTCDRFMVIRTRTNVLEDSVAQIGRGLNGYLDKKFVQVIIRQKTDDPFQATLTVTPAIRLEKTLKHLTEEGYEEEPCPPIQVCVTEGDTIEITFRGNIRDIGDNPKQQMPYNTHVRSQLYFSVSEVDKYLQKNFPMFRGLVQVYRKYKEKKAVVKTIGGRKHDGDVEKEPEIKEELLCELLLSIPKYHIEPSSIPVKAPIKIHNTTDPVNEDTMRNLATELGEEWKKVAHFLNVHRVRIQAILRNMNIGERTFDEAKFDMLMTWLKRVPKAANKISILGSALTRSGRSDLAESLRLKEKEYRRHEIQAN